jgi:hypothetical protein
MYAQQVGMKSFARLQGQANKLIGARVWAFSQNGITISYALSSLL